MTPEEITSMAKEAGMNPNSDPDAINALGKSVPLAWIEKLCTLVAEKAAAKERDECANSCEDIARVFERVSTVQPIIAQSCAAAIRARGQKGGV